MKRKHWIWIAVVLIVAIAVVFWLKSGKTESGQAQFTTAKLERGDIENTVSATGTLSALETVEVGSQVSGIVERLYVDYNSSVKKGQVLAVLDKTTFKVSVLEAEARVESAVAELEQLEAELKRNRPLYEKGHISDTEFLEWKTKVATARASLKSAQASLKTAQTKLGYTEIRSPMNGTVIERTVDEGQTIAASFQAPELFLIARDLTKMHIETYVDETDIGQISEGQTVRFTVQSYPDRQFEGTVRQIRLQPTTTNNVVNYTVVVDAENKDRVLLPGMTATVDFVVERSENVLRVPNSALNLTPPDSFEIERPKPPEPMESGKRSASDMPPPPAKNGEKAADDMAYVFIPAESGKLRIAMFRKGITDGLYTEVKKSRSLQEGTVIIEKFGKSAVAAAGNNRRNNPFMMGPPPPGRGRR